VSGSLDLPINTHTELIELNKMIQHLHSIICGRVIIDKSTGLASYIDIIEGVHLKDPKNFKLPLFSLVTKFLVKDGLADNQILEVKISKKKTEKTNWKDIQTLHIPLEQNGENLLIDLKVENLDIEEIGLWEFEIKWRLKDGGNWKKGAIVPFNVSNTEPKIVGKNLERK